MTQSEVQLSDPTAKQQVVGKKRASRSDLLLFFLKVSFRLYPPPLLLKLPIWGGPLPGLVVLFKPRVSRSRSLPIHVRVLIVIPFYSQQQESMFLLDQAITQQYSLVYLISFQFVFHNRKYVHHSFTQKSKINIWLSEAKTEPIYPFSLISYYVHSSIQRCLSVTCKGRHLLSTRNTVRNTDM